MGNVIIQCVMQDLSIHLFQLSCQVRATKESLTPQMLWGSMLEQHHIKCFRLTVKSTGRNTKSLSPLIPHGFADGQTHSSEADECALHYIFMNNLLTLLLVISPCTTVGKNIGHHYCDQYMEGKIFLRITFKTPQKCWFVGWSWHHCISGSVQPVTVILEQSYSQSQLKSFCLSHNQWLLSSFSVHIFGCEK